MGMKSQKTKSKKPRQAEKKVQVLRNLAAFDSDLSDDGNEDNLGADTSQITTPTLEDSEAAEVEGSGEDFPSSSDAGEEGKEGDQEGEDDEEGMDPAEEYSIAFAKIMHRRIATNAPGPILAGKRTLLATKLDEESAEKRARKEVQKKKQEDKEKNHVLPATHTDAYERQLIKIATKGVVKLFNAVSKAQKSSMDLSNTGTGKGKSSSAALIAELRGTVKQSPAATGSASAQTPIQPSTWGVLQDKFDMGKTGMKHWDVKEKSESSDGEDMNESDDSENEQDSNN